MIKGKAIRCGRVPSSVTAIINYNVSFHPVTYTKRQNLTPNSPQASWTKEWPTTTFTKGAYIAEAIEDTPGANDFPNSGASTPVNLRCRYGFSLKYIHLKLSYQLPINLHRRKVVICLSYRSPCKKIAHDILREVFDRLVDEMGYRASL